MSLESPKTSFHLVDFSPCFFSISLEENTFSAENSSFVFAVNKVVHFVQQLQELLLVDEPWIAAFDGIGGEGKKHFVESSSEALKV